MRAWNETGDSWEASGNTGNSGGNSWEAHCDRGSSWEAAGQDWNSGWQGSGKQAAEGAQEKDAQWKAAEPAQGSDWKAAKDASWDQWGSGASKDAGAGAAAADQAWGADDGAKSWGNSSRPAGNQGSAADFWSTQQYNKENNILSKKAEWEFERDDQELFQERLGTSAGLCFDRYESVPVDLSGSKSNKIPIAKSFEELYEAFGALIPRALTDNVRRCQYKTPTPVQKYAIPAGLVGRDIMCCAQTGSGKTAAFLLPVIGRMMKHNANPIGKLEGVYEGACEPDTLVVTPTRELCLQIYEEALKFCHRTDYRAVRIYGGEKPKTQLADIALGADIMVATPGRLQDFLNREVVKVQSVSVLVLDEADRMLDMGFEPQIRAIVENHSMPSKDDRQTMMFSATFPDECQKMAQDFLYDYIWIGVGIVGGAVETVEQQLVKVSPQDKYQKLIELLDDFFVKREKGGRTLVFVNAKDTAKWLDEQLYAKNIDTGALHGNLEQWEREKNLQRFRKGEIDVMIATDVAARGLDIESVVLVINYDMPQDIDSYIHRIGRTGRIGNQGTAVTFISCDENSGSCLENAETLKKLSGVMHSSKASIPEWLDGTIELAAAASSASKAWRWGGHDMRPDQETFSGNGAGGEWSKWKGGASTEAGSGGGDSWNWR